MSIESLEKKIKELQSEIKPLQDIHSHLMRQLDTMKSVQFIKENRITKDKVQRCDDEGGPWFDDIYSFGSWMDESNSNKHWCCWNGSLYESSEIISGRMMKDPIGRYEDVLQ